MSLGTTTWSVGAVSLDIALTISEKLNVAL